MTATSISCQKFSTIYLAFFIKWLEPSQVQNAIADIKKGDIMANLPYDKRCSVWFDHHFSNIMDNASKIEGAFEIAPSAAGIVYKYYKEKGKIKKDFDELIEQTDIIDAALLTKEQVLYPEKFPYILLAMTVKNRDETDPPYWNKLVELLSKKNIIQIMQDPDVKARCQNVIKENIAFTDFLKKYTKVDKNISITDFRSLDKPPSGNRFLVYTVFPEAIASMKIRYDYNKDIVIVSLAKSIFNKKSQVNIGKLLARYGGGGHAGAGGCSMKKDVAKQNIKEIIDTMKINKPI